MQCVYQAGDPVEAELVRGLLQAHGIRAMVTGQYLWGGRGELAMDAWPRVCILDPRDSDVARALIADYVRRPEEPEASWMCGCGESSPGSFALCWKCGAEAPRQAT